MPLGCFLLWHGIMMAYEILISFASHSQPERQLHTRRMKKLVVILL